MVDYSKFQKMASDDKCTTLKHVNGHELKIAHKGLSESMRKELDKMPMHGGGKVQKYAEGTGDVQANPAAAETARWNAQNKMEQDQAAQQEAQKAAEDAAARTAYEQKLANWNGGQQPSAPKLQEVKTPDQAPAQIPDQGLAPSGVPNALLQNPEQQAAPSAPQQAKDQEAAEDVSEAAPVPKSAPAPKQEAAPLAPPQNFNDLKQTHKQDYANEDMAWAQDLANQHITPKTYHNLMYDGKGTLGKIGAIFGLMVSSAGAGLAHQPNALLSMMDNTIRNDLEAQKQSKSNAQNFIKMNNDHQLQQAQAANLTQDMLVKRDTLAHMQMNRAALHELKMKVLSYPEGTPQRQQAEQTYAMVSQGVDAMNSNLADKAAGVEAYSKMMMGQPGANDEQQFQQRTGMLRMMGPQGEARAKDLEAKHYPGLQGQASRELSSEDHQSIGSSIEFHNQLRNFMDWTSKHSGDLSPSDIKQGRAMAAELQGAYRNATHGGVYKESEANFISSIIDDNPTKFFNEVRVMPQLRAIDKTTSERINQKAKNLGFQGYQPKGSAGGGGGEIRYDAQGNAWKLGPNGKPVRAN